MRKVALILITLVLCGCKSKEADLTISVRQPWADAVSVAKQSGLKMYDTADLQLPSAPEGFYLTLPDDQALLVFRGSKTDTVAALQKVEHWSPNAKDRVYLELQTYQISAKK